MHVFLNGQFLPETEATVSIFDRSFLYGDGLFETMRVFHGHPFCWTEHMERFQRGAAFLNIKIAHPLDDLLVFAKQLIERNEMPNALLRLTLSRGVGRRGYSPAGADASTLVMTLHPAPDLAGQPPPIWRAISASFRLPANEPLAEFKTCNKLPQILARAEADAAGVDEALLLNTDGQVVEASSSNLFWIQADTVCTPSLRSGVLAGVTRQIVLNLCAAIHVPTCEVGITVAELPAVQGVFVSLSSWGIIELSALNSQELRRSPIVTQLRAAYCDLIRDSCP